MKKYCLDISVFILIFLFSIFALSNLGFVFGFCVYFWQVFVSLIIALIWLFKRGDFFKKVLLIALIFLISFIFANFFIDTSFDGRCYHFTTENLFKLGYNPFSDNIYKFAKENNIYYNLLFSSSYPNALELIRANFYLIFHNMESSKIVNFLFIFAGFFYSLYFALNKLNKIKSFVFALCIFLCAVVICQMNTKMADFLMYHLFVFQIFSILLINKKVDKKINFLVLIFSSILSIAIKYTGVLNTFVIFALWYFLKKKKNILKIAAIIFLSSLLLAFQPYILNLIKHKNSFYPSIGHNKLDFMTKQNPKEFKDKNYIYKFIRSMFSASSDSRMNNPQTPKLHYKIPFTSKIDMPYIAEDIRISGFGHWFSGIFIISVLLTLIQIAKGKGKFAIFSVILTVLLNPICWWARFVPQLHLLPVLNCYYFRKNNLIFYGLSFLLIVNGLWVLKENLFANAYKTYVMNSYYNELFEKTKNKSIKIYMDKKNNDENDSTILFRMNEYGIKYTLVDKKNKDFEKIKTQATISNSYEIKKN